VGSLRHVWALGSEKDFVAVANISGVMIAYAAPGKTRRRRERWYAKALAEEIVRPGIESVVRFRHFDQTNIRDEADELKPVLAQSSSGARYTLVQARSTGIVGRKRINVADTTWKRKCASAASRWKKSANRIRDAVSCAAVADHAASAPT
jgi:hypothetical protein